MKNQNDLIVSIVAAVVFLIVFCLCFFMKPVVTSPSPPEQVNTTPVSLPTNVMPVMANSLSGGSNNGPGGNGGAMGMSPGKGGGSAAAPNNPNPGKPTISAGH